MALPYKPFMLSAMAPQGMLRADEYSAVTQRKNAAMRNTLAVHQMEDARRRDREANQANQRRLRLAAKKYAQEEGWKGREFERAGTKLEEEQDLARDKLTELEGYHTGLLGAETIKQTFAERKHKELQAVKEKARTEKAMWEQAPVDIFTGAPAPYAYEPEADPMASPTTMSRKDYQYQQGALKNIAGIRASEQSGQLSALRGRLLEDEATQRDAARKAKVLKDEEERRVLLEGLGGDVNLLNKLEAASKYARLLGVLPAGKRDAFFNKIFSDQREAFKWSEASPMERRSQVDAYLKGNIDRRTIAIHLGNLQGIGEYLMGSDAVIGRQNDMDDPGVKQSFMMAADEVRDKFLPQLPPVQIAAIAVDLRNAKPESINQMLPSYAALGDSDKREAMQVLFSMFNIDRPRIKDAEFRDWLAYLPAKIGTGVGKFVSAMRAATGAGSRVDADKWASLYTTVGQPGGIAGQDVQRVGPGTVDVRRLFHAPIEGGRFRSTPQTEADRLKQAIRDALEYGHLQPRTYPEDQPLNQVGGVR